MSIEGKLHGALKDIGVGNIRQKGGARNAIKDLKKNIKDILFAKTKQLEDKIDKETKHLEGIIEENNKKGSDGSDGSDGSEKLDDLEEVTDLDRP